MKIVDDSNPTSYKFYSTNIINLKVRIDVWMLVTLSNKTSQWIWMSFGTHNTPIFLRHSKLTE